MRERCYLLIRADANARMGTGHLMRCLALAQAWKARGGQVAFITACESSGLLDRLSHEGFETIQLDSLYPNPADWEATSQVLGEHANAWVVLDGYHFDEAYQQRVKGAGHSLLVIDDMARLDHYYADVVLNQNIHAEQLHYSCEPYTQLLLGTQYVLLRREFLQWQGWKRDIPEVARKVLVTLGGGDPDNVTLKVIRAINKLSVEGLEVKVVIGPSNPHMASLKEAVYQSPFTIHLLPDMKNMPELMASADVAVSAAGSTCWELGFMGLPTILLVLANNQKDIGEGLSEASVVHNLGWFEQVMDTNIKEALVSLLDDREQRQQMSQSGRALVDGIGCKQVVSVLHRQIQAIRSHV